MDAVILPKRLSFESVYGDLHERAGFTDDAQRRKHAGPDTASAQTRRSSLPSQRSNQLKGVSHGTRLGLPSESDACSTVVDQSPIRRGYGLSPVRDDSGSSDQEVDKQLLTAPIEQVYHVQHSISQPNTAELRYLQLQHESYHQAAMACTSGRAAALLRAMMEVEEDKEAAIGEVEEERREKEAALARASEEWLCGALAWREGAVKLVQERHEIEARQRAEQVEEVQRAAARAAEERRLAELEAARKKKEAEEKLRLEKEQQEKQRLEAAALAEKAARARAEAAAASTPTPATAPTKPVALAAKPPAAGGGAPRSKAAVSASDKALEWQRDVERQFKEYTDLVKGIVEDESRKTERRAIEKKMTVHVQQVAGTKDQVGRKTQDVFTLIQSQPDRTWRIFAMMMFVDKVIKQSDLIFVNNRAAFPLAAVLVKISTQFPELMLIMIARLHQECMLTVPRSVSASSGLAPAQYLRALGYKVSDDPNTPGAVVLESDDSFYKRLEGLMVLYAAIIQTDENAHPHGLEYGWSWMARCLNGLPYERPTAKALSSFSKIAGFKMASRFGNQFIKLLLIIRDEVLPELARSQDSESQAVRTRLEHYISSREYMTEPEGRAMPAIDQSAYIFREWAGG